MTQLTLVDIAAQSGGEGAETFPGYGESVSAKVLGGAQHQLAWTCWMVA